MLRDELQHAVQTAGGIGHLHGDHTGAAQGEAVFLENGFGFFLVINDEAQDTEIGGISQGKSADVDAGPQPAYGLIFGQIGRRGFPEKRKVVQLSWQDPLRFGSIVARGGLFVLAGGDVDLVRPRTRPGGNFGWPVPACHHRSPAVCYAEDEQHYDQNK